MNPFKAAIKTGFGYTAIIAQCNKRKLLALYLMIFIVVAVCSRDPFDEKVPI